jgi:hypothetical protein
MQLSLRWWLLPWAIALLSLAGCEWFAEQYGAAEDRASHVVDEPETPLGVVGGMQLVALADDESLHQLLQVGLRNHVAGQGEVALRQEGAMPETTSAPAILAPMTDSGGAAKIVSTTNLQEQGVDELDWMKISSDGTLLYYLTGRAAQWCCEAMPLALSARPAAEEENTAPNRLTVWRLREQPASHERLTAIELRSDLAPAGLYHYGDGLVVVYGQQQDIWLRWWNPWQWQTGQVVLEFYDLSANATQPRWLQTLEIDGQMVTTRRIGETLYLVSRRTPLAGDADALTPQLPQLRQRREGVESAQPLISATACYAAPVAEKRQIEPTLISLTAIPLARPQEWRNLCYIGSSETFYLSASGSAWFAAATSLPVAGGEAAASEAASSDLLILPPIAPLAATQLHHFTLQGVEMHYRGSAQVIGDLGWEDHKKPFRLGQYGDYLAIFTSEGAAWSEESSTRLTVLRQREGEALTEVATLDNLGKPGERLYAARFVGKMAYLVTFRLTDPLYAIRLDDAENLAADRANRVGELEISGYSDYLQLIGENWLLGIGKDAVADSPDSTLEPRGAWAQGVKIALFDVSDPLALREVDSLVIGKRGSDSAASYGHHGITFVADSVEGERLGRLALPIRRHDRIGVYWQEGDPAAWYDWSDTALHQLAIHRPEGGGAALRTVGTIVAATASDSHQWDSSDLGRQRSVMVNDSLHYLLEDRLISADWGSGAERE